MAGWKWICVTVESAGVAQQQQHQQQQCYILVVVVMLVVIIITMEYCTYVSRRYHRDRGTIPYSAVHRKSNWNEIRSLRRLALKVLYVVV
jgi:heme/copper-type cytochrome/quinol oxidase subunit 2